MTGSTRWQRLGWVASYSVLACSSTPGWEEDSTGHGKDSKASLAPAFGETAGTPASQSACAQATSVAEKVPAAVVVLLDKSLSMGGRWAPCTQALQGFFSNPKTSGMTGALTFFPSAWGPTQCGDEGYVTPRVPARALPEATAFAAAMTAEGPNTLGTPTLPAMRGAIRYARSLRAEASPPPRIAIMLVTDGMPFGCSSTVTSVAQEIGAAAKEGISTFVIGFGDAEAMHTFAKAGGSGQAFIISPGDAKQTGTDVAKALDAVRARSGACELKVPKATGGGVLNLASVNVQIRWSRAPSQPDTLRYEKDCSGAGWHYDQPETPQSIRLCPSLCEQIQADAQAVLELSVGCTTAGTDGTIPR